MLTERAEHITCIYLCLEDALPSLFFFFCGVFKQVLEIRPLIYKDASGKAAPIVHRCLRLSKGPPFACVIDAILSHSKWRLHTASVAFNFQKTFR